MASQKKCLDEEDITLDLGDGEHLTFRTDYLLSTYPHSYHISKRNNNPPELIRTQIEDGVAIDQIWASVFTSKNHEIRLRLDNDIWAESLLAGPAKKEFRRIWDIFHETNTRRKKHLDKMRFERPYLDNNARLFIQDLMSFNNPVAETRLSSTAHRFYLGEPYFSHSAVADILAIPLAPSTLGKHLERVAKKSESVQKGVALCAGYELAPLFLRAFGWEWNGLRTKKVQIQKARDVKGDRGDKGNGGAMNTLKHKLSLFGMKDSKSTSSHSGSVKDLKEWS